MIALATSCTASAMPWSPCSGTRRGSRVKFVGRHDNHLGLGECLLAVRLSRLTPRAVDRKTVPPRPHKAFGTLEFAAIPKPADLAVITTSAAAVPDVLAAACAGGPAKVRETLPLRCRQTLLSTPR